MKKLLALCLTLVMAVTCVSCGTQSSTPPASSGGASASTQEPEWKEYKLKLGTIWTDADPSTAAVAEFSKLVADKTGGAIDVVCYNNSQLGGSTELLSGMPAGTLEMYHGRISTYGFLEGASMFNICSAPFIWNSNQELYDFLQTDVAQKWFDEAAAATGVRVILAKGECEARQLTASRPIASAADFEGLKIRTADSVVVQSTMKALGAIPSVVAFSDLYMALRQGTVEAQENGFITIKNNSLFEVQEYLMRTDYIRDISIFCIAESIWQEMDQKTRDMMIECANIAADVGTEQTNAQIEEAFEGLKSDMTYVEIDVKSIQDKLGNVYENLDGEAWAAGAYAAVKEFKDSYAG